MDQLDITDLLKEFPSEDIRSLLAKELNLTVEQVSQKMDEFAISCKDKFPADDFIKFASKGGKVTLKHYVNDLNGNGEYGDAEDVKLSEKIVERQIDTDKDSSITYKIATLDPEANVYDTSLGDLKFKTKKADLGIVVGDMVDLDKYSVYTSYARDTQGTNEYITINCDYYLDNNYYVSEISGFNEVLDRNTFVADGSAIIIQKK